jgi:hypothetical protein
MGIKILLCVNIGLTGKIEEKISIAIIPEKGLKKGG